MKVTVLVTCGYALEAIVGHEFDLILRQHRNVLRYNLIEIVLHELEDEEEAVFLSDHFLQFDDVMMVELAQRFDLAKLHSFVPGCELRLHTLDGDNFIGRLVTSLCHAAEGSVAHGFNNFILFHLDNLEQDFKVFNF